LIGSIKAIRFTDFENRPTTGQPINSDRGAAMSDMTQFSLFTRATPGFLPRASSVHRGKARRLVFQLRQALRIYLTRRALPELSPRQLADIGLSSSMAVEEASRLPWDHAPTPRQTVFGTVRQMLERARRRRLVARQDALQRNLSHMIWH
jgi:uncharacterized protein YjiS (DUF1127 family)